VQSANPSRGLGFALASEQMLGTLPWARPALRVESLIAPDWAREAACRDLEPEQADALFFPQRGEKGNGAGPL